MSEQSAAVSKELWKQQFAQQWCELLDGNPHVPNILAWAEALHAKHGSGDPGLLARAQYLEMREKLLGRGERPDFSAPH